MAQNQLTDPRTAIGSAGTLATLMVPLIRWLQQCQQQVNRLSSESISGSSTAAASPPPANSTTIYAAGDYVRNTAPAVLGSAGSQYVVKGWVYTGTAWVQDRGLTGT